MTENERYEQICKPAIEDLKKLTHEIHCAVVKGNGQPSLTVRMAKAEQVIRGILWFVGVVVIALVGVGIAKIF